MESNNQFVVIPLQELIALLEEIFKRFRNEQNEPYHGHVNDTKKLYTRNEIATILKVTPNTISRYRKKKLLHGTKWNGVWRFSEKELIRFISGKAK